MNKFLWCIIFLLTTSAAAAKQSPCRKDVSFGKVLGSIETKDLAQRQKVSGGYYLPSESYEPFTFFEALVSPQSNTVWGVEATAEFLNEDEASAFSESLLSSIRSDLRISDEKTLDGITMIYTGTAGRKETALGKEIFIHTDGLYILLASSSKDVTVTCKDLEVEGRVIEEYRSVQQGVQREGP